jgi:hypothetical protein
MLEPPTVDNALSREPRTAGAPSWGWMAVAIFALLVLKRLLYHVLTDNESVMFPWALQSVDTGWLPNDWFLNTPVGNQLITATFIGSLIKWLGFLPASLAARVFAYGLLAVSLTRLLRKLSIPTTYAIIALAIFISYKQSIAAGESIVGPAESKVFAYVCIFFALPYLLDRKYWRACALVGVATSIHFLVGGYAFLATLLFLVYDRATLRVTLTAGAIWFVCAGVGIYHVTVELLATFDAQKVAHIIVYLRHPHHLLPSYWHWPKWVKLAALCAAWAVAYRGASQSEPTKRLLVFAAFTMVPFFAGIAIAPFDHNGTFLRLYLFRLGDTLFPLFVLLCLYHALLVAPVSQRTLQKSLTVAASLVMVYTGLHFGYKLWQFTGSPSDDTPWVEACTWLRHETPRDAIILAPPGKESFTLLARRACVSQFKFFPFTEAAVSEWYQRLLDVSGGSAPTNVGFAVPDEVNDKFYDLPDSYLRELMAKYRATYVLTTCAKARDLQRVYSNDTYCVYD